MAESIEKLKEQIELLKKKNQLLEEGSLTAEERAAKRKKEAEAEQERLKITVERLAYESKIASAQGETIEYYEATVKFLNEYNKLKETALGNEEILKQLGLETAEELENMLDKAEKAKERLAEFGEAGVNAYKKTKPLFEDIATKMFLFSPGANKAIAKMKEIGKIASDKKGLAGMTEAFKKTFNAQNIALGLMTKFISFTLEYAFAVDKATAAFAKNTGLGRAFTTQISEIGNGYRNLGIEAKDVAKATEGLINSFPMLTKQTKENKDAMILAATSLEKIGVGSETTGKMLTFFTKNLKMSGQSASKAAVKIGMLGNALGKSAKQITKEFTQALKVLAVYGPQSTKIFAGIASMAHSAGVEIGTLMKMAGKFDEFGSSAETAAKLNAVLGTKLSGVNLMMMDEEQKIEAVIQAIQRTGQTFGTMDKFKQRLIANVTGITDLNEAQKVFGMNLSAYKMHKAEALKNADAQKQMEDKMKQAMATVEKLKKALMNIAITLGPFTDTIADVAQGIADAAAAMNSGVVKAILYAGAIGMVVKFVPGLGLLVGSLAGLILKLPLFSAAAAGATGPLAGLGTGLGALGVKGSVGIPVLLSLAAVFAGLGLAAKSIAEIPLALVSAATEVSKLQKLFVIISELNWQESFSGIGPALKKAQADLQMLSTSEGVQITHVLENLALIKTGRSARAITSSVMSTTGVGDIGSDIKSSLKGAFKGLEVTIQLDGAATTKALRGEIVKTTLQ